jgi:hypothetical protein
MSDGRIRSLIGLKWTEADTEASCLRLKDSKEGNPSVPLGCLSSSTLNDGAPSMSERTSSRGRVRTTRLALPEPLEAYL